MKINLLNEWHLKMQTHYWKLAFYPTNTIQYKFLNLKTLRIIHNNIESFFSEEEYILKENKGQLKLNWLQNYLYVTDPRFIGYARELAIIISYYNTSLKDFQKLNIQSKGKDISRLRDRLFELFINFILQANGFNSIPNASYFDNGKEKPMDSYFKLNNKSYIVECAKIYDTKQSVLLKTVMKVIRKIFIKKGKLVKMKSYIQPSGYILFKNTKNINITEHQIETEFSEMFDLYLSNMNSKSECITPYAVRENEIYKIFVGSNLFYKFSDEEKEFTNNDLVIHFRCNIKYDNIEIANFQINAAQKRNTAEEYELIIARIKAKRDQHKNSPPDFNLCICLEFEEGISVNEEERPLNIDLEHLNLNIFLEYIDEKTSLFFISKKYNNMQAYYETKFLFHPSADPVLIQKLNHLKFPHWINQN